MKTPKAGDTVLGWARDLRKQVYGKESKGSVEKSKRRHNAKQLALNKHK
jgi:hypothetical protein